MTAGWVAVSVRARAMSTRRLGAQGARRVASSPSLVGALTQLTRTPPFDGLPVTDDLAAAEHDVVAATLWDVRVLAGWAPRSGVMMLAVLVGALEASNIRDRLRALEGASVAPPYALGALATAWPRVARAESLSEVRSVLATSAWGDPGTATRQDVGLVLDLALADRVVASVPPAVAWASGAAALLVAREVVRDRRSVPAASLGSVARVVGERALAAPSLPDLAGLVRADARWALAGVQAPDDLWRAEARWWSRVERDGAALLRRPGAGPEVLVGAVALLAADTWRVRAALELAARGGGPLEVLDEVG